MNSVIAFLIVVLSDETVKLVVTARDRGEAADLYHALVELAAVAMDWAATSRRAACE